MHRKLAAHFQGRPNGGIHIGDGAVPDLTPQSARHKGVIPRGWESTGKSWNDVPGAYDPGDRQVLMGNEDIHKHGSDSLARHEVSHAFDDAIGRVSSTQEWRDVAGYAIGASVHPYFQHKTNPHGLWSEGFAEGYAAWAAATASGADPVKAIAKALDIPTYHRDNSPDVQASLRNMVQFFERISQ